MSALLVETRNGHALPRARVPKAPWLDLRAEITRGVARGERLSALFGCPHPSGGVALLAVLAADHDGVLRLGSAVIEGESYPCLTAGAPEAHLFQAGDGRGVGARPGGPPVEQAGSIRTLAPGRQGRLGEARIP